LIFLALGLTASGSTPALFFELVLGLEVFANLAPVGMNLFLNLDPRFSQDVKRHAGYQIVHLSIC
jgi:hypothetical protein